MPCMCGDLYCWSCGPAQGNSKCRQCGAWSLDGGCEDPEKCRQAEQQEMEALAAQFKWEREYFGDIEQ